MNELLNDMESEERHLKAIILTPTRELAMQITKDFQQLAHFTDIQVHLILFLILKGKRLSLLSEDCPTKSKKDS